MGRTYVLELVAGQSIFRREELDLLIENVIQEAHSSPAEDHAMIVPEKLAKFFPEPR